MAMFADFHKRDLDIKRLNYGVIILVPKVKDSNDIKQYHPICLLNVDFKIFTKALNNRFTPIAKELIGSNQTGFIKGRHILEGVVCDGTAKLKLKIKRNGRHLNTSGTFGLTV